MERAKELYDSDFAVRTWPICVCFILNGRRSSSLMEMMSTFSSPQGCYAHNTFILDSNTSAESWLPAVLYLIQGKWLTDHSSPHWERTGEVRRKCKCLTRLITNWTAYQSVQNWRVICYHCESLENLQLTTSLIAKGLFTKSLGG